METSKKKLVTSNTSDKSKMVKDFKGSAYMNCLMSPRDADPTEAIIKDLAGNYTGDEPLVKCL